MNRFALLAFFDEQVECSICWRLYHHERLHLEGDDYYCESCHINFLENQEIAKDEQEL